MKIIFFTTNSSFTSEQNHNIKELPAREKIWKDFIENYTEFEIIFAVQKPAHYLLDNSEPSGKIKTFVFPETASAETIAGKIASEKPDLAVPVTYWESPFDWLSLKDSEICEILKSFGIQTASHPEKTAEICFNKERTRDFLSFQEYNIAKGVYIHHELYWAERNHIRLCENVYKEFVQSKIRKLSAPLVIKDTTGLSSYGMDVAKTHSEAFHILNSKKTNGDRIVEEFLEGFSFGIEIYGSNNRYDISPLFINSVNQFGLTSPKQNVKLGPVMNNKFRIYDLYRDLERLSSDLKLNGICQVDLVFHKGNWHIVEINSRISGMTETAAAAMNLTLPELLVYASFLGKEELEKTSAFSHIQKKIRRTFVMNMKFPLLSEKKLEKLYGMDSVVNANQIRNLEAKQLREEGYAEIIFGKTETLKELSAELEKIKNAFPDDMEKVFYENALNLIREIG